ncbi:MAG TPA: PAC2 family protein [Dermatophilaceae bacterium]|nr:PAC2 family protein [Dermatophilaceae bacterium]
MVHLHDVPEGLRDPVLVAAFEGWNDAGDAASQAVAHLVEVWGAREVGVLDPEDYYDFQVNRPRVRFDDGRRVLSWPSTRILVATPPSLARDVVLVQGIEPSTRWRSYVAELLDAAGELGVSLVVTLGALLADVPHTRPIPVITTSDDPATRERYGVGASDYEGPTGIVGVLAHAAAERELAALSSWARVPHYAGAPPSPKAALALVGRLEALLELTVAHGDLDEQAQAWERGVDELAESDDEVADYVHALEEDVDTADLPEASGDAIALEFERYLRRRGDERGDS